MKKITMFNNSNFELEVSALPITDDRKELLKNNSELVILYEDWEKDPNSIKFPVWEQPSIMWRDKYAGNWHYMSINIDPSTIPGGMFKTPVQGIWTVPENTMYFWENEEEEAISND